MEYRRKRLILVGAAGLEPATLSLEDSVSIENREHMGLPRCILAIETIENTTPASSLALNGVIGVTELGHHFDGASSLRFSLGQLQSALQNQRWSEPICTIQPHSVPEAWNAPEPSSAPPIRTSSYRNRSCAALG
jgi:hypothetical protein